MISSIACCVGCRDTAVQTTRPRAGAARLAAFAGVTWRTDSAKTKPMASTPADRQASTASGVVMPQILIHTWADAGRVVAEVAVICCGGHFRARPSTWPLLVCVGRHLA